MIAYALGALLTAAALVVLFALGWFVTWLLGALADIALLIASYINYPKGRR